MLHHALSGFLRVSLIDRCYKVVPKKLFRRRILRNTPAIQSSVFVLHIEFVLHIDKICDADVALHLQSCDARFKPGIAVKRIQE